MSTPTHDSDVLKQARARLRAQDARGAVHVLKNAISAGTQTGEILELLGIAHGMAGKTSAARAALDEATKLDPSRATAHYNYAVVLARDGELEHAFEEANTAVYLDSKHQGAAQLQTQLSQQMRDRRYIGEEAFTTVKSAPSADPNGPLAGLTCTVCGKNNLFSARVCKHCGTFIKEMPDVVPVE